MTPLRIHLLFAFFCSFFATPGLRAQTSYYFKHYEVEHGLSNNNVLCTAMDKNGFMWFGTIDGLNRFDGYTFKNYRRDPTSTTSIGNNSVYTLLATDNDLLWIGTSKGLYIYNPVTDVFRLIDSTANHVVRSICRDKGGNFWLSADYRLAVYNETTKKFRWFPTDSIKAISICTDDGGTVWIGTRDGFVSRYEPGRDSFTSFNLFTQSQKPSSRNIIKIFNTQKGSLLVGTLNQGIKLFDIQTRAYKDILIYNKDKTEIFAKDFVQYSDNEYWAATECGIYIYNIASGKVTSLHMEYNNSYSISDNAINTLFRDKEGGVWAGTRFGGLCYYPFPYTAFDKYFSRSGDNSIKGNGVHEICPDGKGHLWIGTEDAGLNKLDLNTKKFTNYSPDGKKGSISYSNIHGLLIAGDELWIGTYQYGIDRMKLSSEKVIKHYTAGKNSFRSNFIVHLFRTGKGKIMVGTWEGLYQYNAVKDSFDLVDGFPFQTQSIVEDKNGVLWICTLGNGVFSLNDETGQVRHFRARPDNKDSLPDNMVNGQFIDSHGYIWFATEGGLSKYDPAENKFKTYTTANGFPANFLFKILEDKKENLWISSTKGLIRFNPFSESVKIFTVADGLLNNQFNWNSAYKDSAGKMYFGSVKGMISFDPENFTSNNINPPVYITGIQVYNKELAINKEKFSLTKSITYTDKVTLPHNRSTISIDFAALSYTSPEKNEYAYKMEGLDNEWTPLKSNRKAYFTELPPGSYTFRVKAANNSGQWNNHETSLRIEILPPFWKSTQAYLVYIILSVLLVYWLFRIYHNKVQERHERKMELLEHQKEKELYENKMDFFTAIAHEIRTPLTLIKGPMENIMNHSEKVPELKNNLRIMEKNTNRLIDISNQLLDFRKIEAHGFRLNLEEVNVTELVQEAYSGFQPLAEKRKLNFSLKLPADDIYALVDTDSLQKILSNLFSNAIKYADNFIQATFSLSQDDQSIQLEIKNDGFLISAEIKEKIFEPFFRVKETSFKNGTGIGLAISRALTELHKGTLELKEPGDGFNTFILKMPVGIEKNKLQNNSTFNLNTENNTHGVRNSYY